MKHPKYIIAPSLLNLAENQPAVAPRVQNILLKRAILDLKLKDCSYNEIIDHLARAHGITVTKGFIEAAILEAGARAKHLNGIYDFLALQKVRVLEVDEIYQGQQNCYLGATDKASTYLFLLAPPAGLDAGALAATLAPLAGHADRLELVITDLRAAYVTVIPATFEEVAHLLCGVHALRTIMEEQEASNRAARRARRKVDGLREDLAGARDYVRAKQRQLGAKKRRLAAAIMARDAYYRAHGIRRYSKWVQPIAPLRAFKDQLNYLRADTRSKENTVQHAREKVKALKAEIRAAGKEYWQKKQASLQAGRLVRRFKDLLACPPGQFTVERERLEEVLRGSASGLAPKLLKFLRDHPGLFTAKVARLAGLCPPNHANTNTIEGIFGKSRPLLDKARHFGDTPTATALFAAFRLRHNLTPPYTGPHNRQSPLERCGIHSRYANYLDALFPLPWQDPCTPRAFNKIVSQVVFPRKSPGGQVLQGMNPTLLAQANHVMGGGRST